MKTIRTTLFTTLLAFTTAFTVPGGFAAGANTAAAATTDNWVDFRDTSWGNDYSTATNFTITTAEQLAQLAYLVEQGNNFSGKTITLDSDISLADHFWTPIGRLESLGFRGTFDGNGHTISGLYTAKKASIYTGLFGALGCGISGSQKNAIVKSLTISNSDIKGYEAESGTQCATGTIVGYLFYGTIEDCVVTSDVTVSSGSDCTGGIVGRMLYGYSRLMGCLCAATVTGTNMVGGLVGEAMRARVSSCLYTGSTVTSTTNATTVAATIGNNNEATLNNTYYTNSSASNNSTDKLACEVDFNIIGTDVTIDLYELHVFTHSGITENYIFQDYNEYYSMSYDGKLYANHSMAFKPSVPVGYKLSCNVTPTTSRVSPSDSPVPGGISAGTTTADVTVPGGFAAGTTTDNDELKALLGDNPIATYGDRMTIYDRGVKLGDDYYSHVITFNDQQDNTTVISQLEGLTFDVRLKHRRLYKDGSWNSLCLPFNLDVVNSPLKGAYTLMELDNKSHDVTPEGATTHDYRQTGCSDDGKLYLFFTRVYDHIYAAKPYIIRWDKVSNYDQNDSSFDILDPIFSNVTISDATTEANKFTSSSDGGKLEFIGLYKPLSREEEDLTLLYFGSNNLLYNPAGRGTVTIGAFRAYFQLNGGVQLSGQASEGPAGGGDARTFSYDIVYGDDTALHHILTPDRPVPGGISTGTTTAADSWYDLGGRRLLHRPTTKGVYIHQGRPFVVM